MNIDSILDVLSFDPWASFDVAEVALQLAVDEYPDLDVDAYLCEVAAIAHESRGYVRGDLRSRTAGLCRYLFHEMGFRGNAKQYHDPRNSYLNQVMDRRLGLPITLSITAMAVGARAGLEVVGVGLPGHFVVKAVADGEEVIFDPFHGGRFLTAEDCEAMVIRITEAPIRAAALLEATSLGSLVQRMLTNLKAVYWKTGDFARAVRVIERLRQLLPHDPGQRRDLGMCLLQGGQAGRAIDHLAAYLADVPRAADTATVRAILRQAESAVARWN